MQTDFLGKLDNMNEFFFRNIKNIFIMLIFPGSFLAQILQNTQSMSNSLL